MQMCRRDCSRRPEVASTSDEGEVGGGSAGRHVARVLHVARAVRDDELSVRRGRVPVRDVDGDALLALGAQPVRDEGEVDLAEAPAFRCRFDRGDLVVEELAGVVEKSADERALAVVDRSDRGEPEEVHRVDADPGAADRRRAGQRRHGSRSSPRACDPPWPSPRTGRRRAWLHVPRCAPPTPRG